MLLASNRLDSSGRERSHSPAPKTAGEMSEAPPTPEARTPRRLSTIRD
jgi:hypothetical protein